jgi:hypothetical protein
MRILNLSGRKSFVHRLVKARMDFLHIKSRMRETSRLDEDINPQIEAAAIMFCSRMKNNIFALD